MDEWFVKPNKKTFEAVYKTEDVESAIRLRFFSLQTDMKYKHLKLEDFNRDNDHLYVQEPDADFSPEHNYSVIQRTIEVNMKTRNTIDPVVQKNAGNVADILASFAKYKLDLGGEKKLEAWLGKENLSRIYGEKLMSKLRILESVKKLNRAKGNTKYENFYLS